MAAKRGIVRWLIWRSTRIPAQAVDASTVVKLAYRAETTVRLAYWAQTTVLARGVS
jgi:hypothetical protein